NYTDYKAEQEAEIQQKKPEKVVFADPEKSDRKKLSFKEQRELEGLERDISSLEGKIAGKTREMTTITDHERLITLGADIENLQQLLDDKSERWMELSEQV